MNNFTQARRCVLYARLSVTKEESVSIERQLQSCRRYAEARGWEVLGEFVDDGVSATANRPEERRGWTSLLVSGDFDAVVIWKVDRLARRGELFGIAGAMAGGCGIDVDLGHDDALCAGRGFA